MCRRGGEKDDLAVPGDGACLLQGAHMIMLCGRCNPEVRSRQYTGGRCVWRPSPTSTSILVSNSAALFTDAPKTGRDFLGRVL